MNKIRWIRTKNNLLAIAGAGLLTLELLFAHAVGGTTVPAEILTLGLLLFWFGNVMTFIIVVTGFSERFRDPSLTLPQMYWAVVCCLLSLIAIPADTDRVFLLIFVTSVFGVFRLKPITFNIFSMSICAGLAAVMCIQLQLDVNARKGDELAFTWVVFSGCVWILSSLCSSMARLRGRLKEKNEALNDALLTKSQFLANMSHEIRTPMNGVLGMLELIDSNALNPNQKRYLGVALASGRSLLDLINDILDFSKIDAGKLSLGHNPCNIKSILYSACEAFYIQAEQKGIEFIVDIDPYIPDLVYGDEIRLRQIFSNVVGNALKFTSEGQIYVSVENKRKTEHTITLDCAVKDTGCGIAQDDKERIFDTFTQSDNSDTRQYGGTGLGLAIARQLCQLMGGEIRLESTLGKGSDFYFSMDLKVKSDEAEHQGELAGGTVALLCRNVAIRCCLEKQLTFLGLSVVHADIACLQDGSVYEIPNVTAVITDLEGNDDSKSIDLLKLNSFKKGVPVIVLVRSRQIDFNVAGEALRYLRYPFHVRALYDAILCANDSGEATLDSGGTRTKSVSGHALLVEDNETNQEVARLLIEDSGLKVDVASDGRIALTMLREYQGHYDMIFMDCQMPNMDGYATTQAIRAGDIGERDKNIPIIAMTANALNEDKQKCLDAGMNDYISKPVSFDAVRDRVKIWLVSEAG